MSKGWFEIFIASMYGLTIIGAGIFLSWMTIQKKKNMESMKENLKRKLTAGVRLSSKEVVFIGRAFSLGPASSRSVVYKLFASVDDTKEYDALKALVIDIEKDEPFDELPDEVKPSLSRLSKIIEASKDDGDKHVLLPITSTLNKYVELKSEQDKIKKQNSRAYVITIISFIVGAVSFYFTLRSPGEAEIKRAVEQALLTQRDTPAKQPQQN